MQINAPLKISYPSLEDQKTHGKNLILSFSTDKDHVYLHRGDKLLAYGLAGEGFSVEQVKEDLKARKRWHKATFVEGALKSCEELEIWGTPFQLKVWEVLLSIPKGQTKTYGEVALLSGFPKAHRAVGTAVGQNPISVLIPCHRVVPKNRKMGHYHWGEAFKKRLLDDEEGERRGL